MFYGYGIFMCAKTFSSLMRFLLLLLVLFLCCGLKAAKRNMLHFISGVGGGNGKRGVEVF